MTANMTYGKGRELGSYGRLDGLVGMGDAGKQGSRGHRGYSVKLHCELRDGRTAVAWRRSSLKLR